MITVTIDKAEKELAAIVKRARSGEEIAISDGVGADVKLAPIATQSYCGRGVLKSIVQVSDADLFKPLPEQELERWWGARNEK